MIDGHIDETTMQNDMRDRLTTSIENAKKLYYGDVTDLTEADYVSECLLSEGVVLPPCKVGQTVWFIRNKEIIETCVEKIILKQGGLYIETTCNSIGKTVFLTKDQAEQTLKEMRNNNG